jgi:hypothetical protein
VAVGRKNPTIKETVATAYKIADAMFAELEKEAGDEKVHGV